MVFILLLLYEADWYTLKVSFGFLFCLLPSFVCVLGIVDCATAAQMRFRPNVVLDVYYTTLCDKYYAEWYEYVMVNMSELTEL